MPLTLSYALALALHCAPSVSPSTLLAIAEVESGLEPLAIGVNGAPQRAARAATPSEAAALAGRLIAEGRSVDLGLAQINSANLARLGLTLHSAFEPCANLAGAARLLTSAVWSGSSEEAATLRRALSIYNTGDPARGVRNGYVAKVLAAASRIAPLIEALPPVGESDRPPPPVRLRPYARWDVFVELSAPKARASFTFAPKEVVH